MSVATWWRPTQISKYALEEVSWGTSWQGYARCAGDSLAWRCVGVSHIRQGLFVKTSELLSNQESSAISLGKDDAGAVTNEL